MRDLADYASKYCENNFEEVKVKYRRKMLLDMIEGADVQNILEIGCGMEPLFHYADTKKQYFWTVVEPCDKFYANALRLRTENVILIKDYFENGGVQAVGSDFDMIICSSLLHEVEDPKSVLRAIASKCRKHTIVHVNVPNANSMHRRLGKAMGLIGDVHEHSENNIEYQQNIVFDKKRLKQMLQECGLEAFEEGGFFIKPFSHIQMSQMLQTGIIDERVLDGLNQLGICNPEYASEIWANCRLHLT